MVIVFLEKEMLEIIHEWFEPLILMIYIAQL